MSIELIEQLRRLGDPLISTDYEMLEQAARRIEELERDLLNLVCRIHRDGGHYIAKYGEAKAIADADTVAAQNNADIDALQADNARLREALDEAMYSNSTATSKQKAADALAFTTERSLAEYRNKVIEECAVIVENCEPDDNGRLSIQ